MLSSKGMDRLDVSQALTVANFSDAKAGAARLCRVEPTHMSASADYSSSQVMEKMFAKCAYTSEAGYMDVWAWNRNS